MQRRLLREHAKAQADAVAVARWESTMGQRDAIAQKKRDDQKLREDLRLADVKVTQSREQKLKQLYADDAERYKAELHKRGLTFRSA